MGKKLGTYVTVHDDDLVPHTFAPGDDLPKWAADRITNPNVWDDAEPAAPEYVALDDAPEIKIPPKGGPGSGATVWRNYASEATRVAGLNIDISDDATRDDIIVALESAGIPTE